MAATKTSAKKSNGKAKTSNGSKQRCWDGYEPVPGKKPFSKGSCKPKS